MKILIEESVLRQALKVLELGGSAKEDLFDYYKAMLAAAPGEKE